jgi:endonuclease YncB( thermonuclease family)
MDKDQEIAYLMQLTNDSLPDFSFEGYCGRAKVVDVYDGDSCRIVFFWGNIPVKIVCRLWGINTPEIRGPDAEEKERGNRAKERVSNLVFGKIVYASVKGTDKYGRSLVVLHQSAGTVDSFETSINMQLVKENLADLYMI